jgi:hypothetical protein
MTIAPSSDLEREPVRVPQNDRDQEREHQESEERYAEAPVSRGNMWVFFSVFIVIAGLTISNGYAINHINVRLDRYSQNAQYLEIDIHRRLSEVSARIDRRFSMLDSNITRLEDEYCRIADQEGDMLMLFKRLSNHYDTISQQLREVNLDSDYNM